MKVGDLVRIHPEYIKPNDNNGEENWKGILLRRGDIMSGIFDDGFEQRTEWIVHWLHHPFGEETFEYEYYLQVLSKSFE